jgi:hypothetical protein
MDAPLDGYLQHNSAKASGGLSMASASLNSLRIASAKGLSASTATTTDLLSSLLFYYYYYCNKTCLISLIVTLLIHYSIDLF